MYKRQVVIKENRPEPFEKRRLQTESLIKSAATSELSGEPETSAYTERVSKTAFPAIADMPAVYGRQPASAGMADAAEQPETLRMPETPKAPEASGPLELPEQEPPKQLDLFEEKLLTKQARNEHVLIGQLFDTYWLVQFHDNLYIIDQHAAHEKVLYEKTMASLKKREYTSQMINPPIIPVSYTHLGCFGIPEPKKSCMTAEETDAPVIVPGVAFSERFERTGYGAGYYDRFFEKEPQHRKIAICYDFQIAEAIAVDQYDVLMDQIITPGRELSRL